jgi:hypothetical protein
MVHAMFYVLSLMVLCSLRQQASRLHVVFIFCFFLLFFRFLKAQDQPGGPPT